MSTTIVVVPCHNEADRLDLSLLAELARAVDALVLVDDGSTDRTAEVLHDFAAASDVTCHVLQIERNAGKAEAVRAGLRRAIELDASVVGYLDADMATPPSELPRLLAALDDAHDVVLGSRVRMLGHDIERKTTRHYLGRVYATFASTALGLDVYDTQCGAKVFRVGPALGSALGQPFDDRWAFDVELLARLVSPIDPAVPPIPRDRFVEVPLAHWSDVDGSALSFGAGLRATASLVGTARRLRQRRSISAG